MSNFKPPIGRIFWYATTLTLFGLVATSCTRSGATGASAMKRGATSSAGAETASASSGPAPKAEATSEATGGGAASRERRVDPPESGQLTAGRWRDLSNWEFWMDLTAGEGAHWSEWVEHWGVSTEGRVAIRVVDGSGRPVSDARAFVRTAASAPPRQSRVVWAARTDNRGRADLFVGAFDESTAKPLELVVTSGDQRRTVHEVTGTGTERRTVELKGEHAAPPVADVMFTVDTTGSMRDELRYLKAELENVVERTQRRTEQRLEIRTSVNFYRDRSDKYVLRPHPFTEDITESVSNLREQRASGGGDYPEAVDRALANAIREHEWSRRARARLLFLVLDAPPHGGDQMLDRLRSAVRAAAKKGVRIIPVASSGVDEKTEFLLRSVAVATGGTYTFLTDHSGIGGDHREPTIGDYEVRRLNNLLVDIVTEYTRSSRRRAHRTHRTGTASAAVE